MAGFWSGLSGTLRALDGIAGDDLVLARRADVLPEPRTRTLERMRSFFIPPWR